MKGIEVVGVQIANRPVADVDGVMENNREAEIAIRKHLERGRRRRGVVFVLPELSSCGYGEITFNNLDVLAEDPINGPSSLFYCALSRSISCYIAFGLVTRDLCDPSLFNISHVHHLLTFPLDPSISFSFFSQSLDLDVLLADHQRNGHRS